VTGYEFSHLTSSLDLLKLGVFRIFNPDQRHRSLREVIDEFDGRPAPITAYADACTDADFDEFRTSATREIDGQPLHQIGFWNALDRVLSPHAVTKIRDVGTFYHLMPENPSASEWGIFWLRGFRSDAHLSTIGTGVESVVDRLEAKIRTERPADPVDLVRNATVRAITRGDSDDKVRLEIEFGERHQSVPPYRGTVDFDHVILALPPWPLKRLDSHFPAQVRDDLDGVIGMPLLKAFLVQEDPWWTVETPAQRGANLVPTRELHYFVRPGVDGAPPIGMVLLYTDRPATAYWQPYVQKPHEHAQTDHPQELRDALVRHLILDLEHFAAEVNTGQNGQPAQLPPLPTRDKDSLNHLETTLGQLVQDAGGSPRAPIISQRAVDILAGLQDSEANVLAEENARVTRFAIRDWSQPPFGAACHAWAPGTNVVQALNRLKAFKLAGSQGPNNLHICGEAYSDYQGFIEGALRSAEAVLATIPPP
jgi:hypothetical protein